VLARCLCVLSNSHTCVPCMLRLGAIEVVFCCSITLPWRRALLKLRWWDDCVHSCGNSVACSVWVGAKQACVSVSSTGVGHPSQCLSWRQLLKMWQPSAQGLHSRRLTWRLCLCLAMPAVAPARDMGLGGGAPAPGCLVFNRGCSVSLCLAVC
jgi:hypothetical protein